MFQKIENLLHELKPYSEKVYNMVKNKYQQHKEHYDNSDEANKALETFAEDIKKCIEISKYYEETKSIIK